MTEATDGIPTVNAVTKLQCIAWRLSTNT